MHEEWGIRNNAFGKTAANRFNSSVHMPCSLTAGGLTILLKSEWMALNGLDKWELFKLSFFELHHPIRFHECSINSAPSDFIIT
jgi:hypothetical protein